MPTPLDILRNTYGFAEFRGHQAAVIEQVVAGGHAFVLMPTGGGKSLCYQIPALCREGVGIIVSPLIALMQDQVEALRQLGIRAAAINSGMESADNAAAMRAIRSGQIDMVYVAPERLLMPDFMDMLEASPVALFAIDEAHCLSQWGHDFRPHYAQLSQLAERFPAVPRIALTATADAPTRRDIIHSLKLDEGKSFVAGFDRPNIHYRIIPKENPRQQVLALIRAHPGQSGIIYCATRKSVEETANWLEGQGVRALPYHAGLEASHRAANQDMFLKEEAVVMVATIAFGMGINKPDVRFVAHLSIPKNIEAYYQETGRAGRDGLPAQALMLYGLQDVALQRSHIENSTAPDAQKRIEHHKLSALLGLCEAACCRRQILLSYFNDTAAPCNNCDTCDAPPETFDATIAAQKALSCAARTGQRFGVNYLIDVLRGQPNERIPQFGHDRLPIHGAGTEHTKPEWQSIFRQLVSQGLLQVDVAEHGGLSLTQAGVQFLKDRASLALNRPAKARERTRSRTMATALAAESGSLLAQLRQLRLELARAQGIPPYVIFHDKTLHEMAARAPADLNEMREISGVGEQKIARYGERFLSVIQQHRAVA